jgi:hypothetical protein
LFIFDRNAYKQTIQHAAPIEPFLSSIVDRQGGTMAGLEFRFKTKESLPSKTNAAKEIQIASSYNTLAERFVKQEM